MKILDILIALSWVAFWSYWLVGVVRAEPGAASGRSIWSRQIFILRFIIILLFYALARHHVGFGYELSRHRFWLKILGTAIVIISLVVAAWGRKQLGSSWGMPMSPRKGTILVTTGPYAYIRDPMYSGLIFALLGSLLALSIVWIFPFIFGTIVFGYSAFKEDKILAKQFPKTYPAYRARTKMLIPYLF